MNSPEPFVMICFAFLLVWVFCDGCTLQRIEKQVQEIRKAQIEQGEQ